MTAERILLWIEMGIRNLDNQRTTDHKEFMSKVENFIKEVKELRTECQQTLQTQASNSKQLVEETNTAYELGFAVLQDIIKGLR